MESGTSEPADCSVTFTIEAAAGKEDITSSYLSPGRRPVRQRKGSVKNP